MRARSLRIELKTPGGRLTPIQRAMHERLTLAGAVLTTASTLEEVVAFLSQLVPLKAHLGGRS